MAEVAKIDIDGVQWDVKDQEARNKIANLENLFITEDLPDVEITLNTGYTAIEIRGYAHYKIGKIHFVTFLIRELAGNAIGTGNTANVATTNLRPKKETSFIMNDYTNKATLRCYIDSNGTFAVAESMGSVSGSNTYTASVTMHISYSANHCRKL